MNEKRSEKEREGMRKRKIVILADKRTEGKK